MHAEGARAVRARASSADRRAPGVCSTPTARDSAESARCRSAGGRSSSDTAREAAHLARQPGTNHAAYRGRRRFRAFPRLEPRAARGALAADAGCGGRRRPERAQSALTAALAHGGVPSPTPPDAALSRASAARASRGACWPADARTRDSHPGQPPARRIRFRGVVRDAARAVYPATRSLRGKRRPLPTRFRRCTRGISTTSSERATWRGRLWRGALARYPRVSMARRR